LTALDTDVLAVYFPFKWDRRYESARRIVDSDLEKATTAVNALELTELMAVAQSSAKALKLFEHLRKRRSFRVLCWRL